MLRMSLIKSVKTLIIIVIILITSTSVSNNDLSSISTRNDTPQLAFGDRILSSVRQSDSDSPTQHHYPSPSLTYRKRRQNQSLRHLPALLGDDKKRKLAKIMKERYLEFRRKLEQSKEDIDPYPYPISDTPFKDASVQLVSRQSPDGRPIYVPSFFESTKIRSNKNSGPVAIQFSKSSPFNMAKKLRSADEATSSSRSSGIRPGSHPFVPLIRPINTSGAQASQRASETATQNVLDERLGPSARPTYDPSIVVDFYSLLQATRQSHGLTRLKPDGRILRTHLDSHPEPQLLIQSESSEEIKVVRRKLHHEPVRDRTRLSSNRTLSSSEQNLQKSQQFKQTEELDYDDDDVSSEKTKSHQDTIRVKHSSYPSTSSDPKNKRAQQDEPVFENFGPTSFNPSKSVLSDESLPSDRLRSFKPLSKIISEDKPFLEKEFGNSDRKSPSESVFKEEPIPDEIYSSYEQTWSEPKFKRAQFLQLPSNVGPNSTMDMSDLSLYISTTSTTEHETSTRRNLVESEFGPHSDGNDPKAGVDPSKVSIPNIDLSTIHLPQGVRDSLRKYLKPLISTLKPLRKSVPGLPGLDYPILSVVPYTNFYCSNMPWPGFYADTEARCQTWHACDIDGRQSTFLCPNGTVFNQALMVCDWWYNTDCLAAPFLYPLNERLFGNFKPEPVTPYTRITPELLDTIFTK